MNKFESLMENVNNGKTIVVFPYGQCGQSVGTYLERMGIEYIPCDNFSMNHRVKHLDQIGMDDSDLCILLSVLDKDQYRTLEQLVKKEFKNAEVLDSLEVCQYGRNEVFNLLSIDKRLNDIYRRIGELEKIRDRFGFDQMGGRIDYRLTRLEILSYYQHKENYDMLDEEQKETLRYLSEDYLKELPRKFFPEDYKTHIKDDIEQKQNVIIGEENGTYFWHIEGKKVFLPGGYGAAQRTAENLYREFFTKHPHNYFDLEEGYTIGDIQSGGVLYDVGAAEGLFSLLLVDKCKKIYLFENDHRWMKCLNMTFAPYKDKVEIIAKTVGDGENGIRLDDFCEDKESPGIIKMDIEGYEASALRGMEKLLDSNNDLTMLICTYHRQDDWDQFEKLLKNKGFNVSPSDGYFWHMPDPMPPFFRHGIMRAVREKK